MDVLSEVLRELRIESTLYCRFDVAHGHGVRYSTIRAAGWAPGLGLAIIGMPFHVPAGPFLAEDITTGDPGRDWWISFAGVFANLAAAGFAFALYIAIPMPFLRILIATNLAVAAFSLIPSHPLDGDRLSSRPLVLLVLGLAVGAASAAIVVGDL